MALNRLPYRIHSCSSVSSKYFPENLLVDAPEDASSRWAGEYVHHQPHPQSIAASSTYMLPPLLAGAAGTSQQAGGSWIVLELKKPAVLQRVLWGKFHRQHPCTLKDYVLQAGMSLDSLKTIKCGALRPDSKPETVDVACRERPEDGGMSRVVKYIKILPLSAQGPNYNISIWHVALFGLADEDFVAKLQDDWEKENDTRTMRSILAHLRRIRHPLYPSLLASSPSAQLEHALLSTLYSQFVDPATPAWSDAEETVRLLAQSGLFDAYLRAGQKKAIWKRLPDLVGKGRGGHQMVEANGKIWVFGGYDGTEDYADLHSYDVAEGKWVERVREDGEAWPSKRSCHKFVLCNGVGWLLGRYVDDPPSRSDPPPRADTSSSSAPPPPLGPASPVPSQAATSPAYALPSAALSDVLAEPSSGGMILATPQPVASPARSDTASPTPSPVTTSAAYALPSGAFSDVLAEPSAGGMFLAAPHPASPPPDSPTSSPASPVPSPRSGRRIVVVGAQASPAARPSASPAETDSLPGTFLSAPAASSARDGRSPIRTESHADRTGPEGSSTDSGIQTTSEEEKNELWRFDFAAEGGKGRWSVVSPNTQSKGGPGLIYDHQMVADESGERLYVYGGTDVGGRNSGMYRYDIREARWTKLFDNFWQGLQSRTGHSMIWNAAKQELYILGGLHSPKYLSDFWIVHLSDPDQPTLSCLTHDYTRNGGPLPAFTQRAVWDAAREEIVVLSGLMKETLESGDGKNDSAGIVKSELWDFSLQGQKWKKVEEQGEDVGGEKSGDMDVDEESELKPTPRFAHSFLYSPRLDSFFLNGGNPGSSSPSAPLLPKQVRLGDFWELKIQRPKAEEVERKILLALRRQQFIEMCEKESSMDALAFLQNQLHSVVDHTSPEESEMFRSLLAHLLDAPMDEEDHPSHSDATGPDDKTFAARTTVFKTISSTFVFDKKAKEPEEQLSDLIDARIPLVGPSLS